jgi:hypothetical protein
VIVKLVCSICLFLQRSARLAADVKVEALEAMVATAWIRAGVDLDGVHEDCTLLMKAATGGLKYAPVIFLRPAFRSQIAKSPLFTK